MTIEIVSFPMKNGGSFHSYVKLPEGSWIQKFFLCFGGVQTPLEKWLWIKVRNTSSFLGKSSKQKAMAFIAMDDLMGETPHLVRWFSQL